jgi:hypothetical protein
MDYDKEYSVQSSIRKDGLTLSINGKKPLDKKSEGFLSSKKLWAIGQIIFSVPNKLNGERLLNNSSPQPRKRMRQSLWRSIQDKSETKTQRKKPRMLVFIKKRDITSAANKNISNVTVLTGQRGLISPHLILLKHILPTLFFRHKKPRKKRTLTLKNSHDLCCLWTMLKGTNSLTSS